MKYGDMKLIFPHEIKQLMAIKMTQKINDHVRLYIEGIVSEEYKDTYVEKIQSTDPIILRREGKDKEKSHVLFQGIVNQVEIKCVRGIYYIYIEAISHTQVLDIKRNKRSFQQIDLSYEALIKEVLSAYPKATFIDEVTQGKKLDHLIVQYEETDWELIKRVASHFEAVIIPDVTSNRVQFWVGLPNLGEIKELTEQQYIISKDIRGYAHTAYNYNKEMYEADFIRYEVETNQYFRLGEKIKFQNYYFIVIEADTFFRHEDLQYRYILATRCGTRQNFKSNTNIKGISIKGIIKEIARNSIRAHFDIDKTYMPYQNFWIPYSAGINNEVMYCMPKVGSDIQVYFQTDREEDIIAIHSIRSNDDGGKRSHKMQNPSVRSLCNDFGKELRLSPNQLLFTANDEESMTIALSDEGVVSITSTKDIQLTAQNNLYIGNEEGETVKKLDISANEFVAISHHPENNIDEKHMIYVDEMTHIAGKEIFYKAEINSNPPIQSFEQEEKDQEEDNELMREQYNNQQQQGYQKKMDAGKKKMGFGAIALAIGVAAVAAVVLAPVAIITGGAALLVAGAGVTAALVGISEMSEGAHDYAKAKAGDLSDSFNFMRDKICGDNKDLYNIIKYGSVTIGALGIGGIIATKLVVTGLMGGSFNTAVTLIGDFLDNGKIDLPMEQYMDGFFTGVATTVIGGGFSQALPCGASVGAELLSSFTGSVTAKTVVDIATTGETNMNETIFREGIGIGFRGMGYNQSKWSKAALDTIGDTLAEGGIQCTRIWKNGESISDHKEEILGYMGQTAKHSMIMNGAGAMLTADPVDAARGYFSLDCTDMILGTLGPTITIARHYNSFMGDTGSLGRGWSFALDSGIFRSQYTLILHCLDGQYEWFRKIDGKWVNIREGKKTYIIEEDQQTGEIIATHSLDQMQYIYGLGGELKAIRDYNGNATTLQYKGLNIYTITAAGGERITCTYENGRLCALEDHIGRKVIYTYKDNYLVRVKHMDGGIGEYAYDNGYMVSVRDQNEHRYVRNQYDEIGRVIRQHSIDGHQTDVNHDLENRTSTYTFHATGRVETYRYNEEFAVEELSYEDGTRETYTYDQWQNKTSMTDRKGYTTRWAYNAYGSVVEECHPDGYCATYHYDDNHHCIGQISTAGENKGYAYDTCGNLTKEWVHIDQEIQAITAYQYDHRGRKIEEKDPEGNITYYQYEYDHIGYPTAVIDPQGHTFRYDYDQVGRNTAITTSYGTVRFTYNLLNYKNRMIDAKGNETSLIYDNMGSLIKKVLPNEYKEHGILSQGYTYEYDAFDRLIQMTDPLGNVFAKKRDAEGNVVKEIHPNAYNEAANDGEGTYYLYNPDNQKVKTIDPEGGITRTYYDANGNVIKAISANAYDPSCDDGAGISYTYDERNRLTCVIDPDGTVMTQYVYDLQGNIIKEIDAYGYKSADTDKERYGTLYRYNMAGWLMEKRVPIDYNEGQVLYNVTVYMYDKVGNCISEQRSPDYVQEHEYPLTWHTLHYTYDLNHRLIKVKDTMGAVIEYAYDCLGNRILEKVKINETKTKTTHYRYNSVGWLERVSEEVDTEDIYKPTLYDISKNRVATIYEYDGNGNVIKAISPEGYITVYEYDQADRLIREGKSEDGKIYRNTGYTYDKAGNLTTQTNCNGYTVQYDYDLLNRRIRITDEEGGITRLFYDATGNIVKVVEPENYNAQTDDGVGTLYKYDNMNRLQVVKDAEGNMVQKNEYDARGELSLQKDAVGSGMSYLRGIDGRIKEMTTAGAKEQGRISQSYNYDARGNITGIQDARGEKTQYALDVWGRITQITQPDGSTECYTYDYAGNVTSTTDGNGGRIQYEYNSLNQVRSIIDQAGEKDIFQYDKESRLARHLNRNNVDVTYAYNMDDSLTIRRVEEKRDNPARNDSQVDIVQGEASKNMTCGEIKRTAYPFKGNQRYPVYESKRESKHESKMQDYTKGAILAERYGYHLDGTLATAQNDGIMYRYNYTPKGQLASKTMQGKPLISYGYNKNGQVSKVQDVTGRLTHYVYDTMNRIKGVYDSGQEVASYKYYPDHMPKSVSFANGVQVNYGYDLDKNRTQATTISPSGKVLLEHSYGYDGNGNQLWKQESQAKTSYTYDTVNRLAAVNYPQRGKECFTYDPAGNRITRQLEDTIETYTYNAKNQLMAWHTNQESTTYQYDKQGNLLSEQGLGKETTYEYDGFNRTVGAHLPNGGTLVHRYDPEGLRAEVEENGKLRKFLFSGRNIIAELDQEDQVTARFIRGSELLAQDDAQDQRYYYHLNEHGDVTHLLDGKANVVNCYEYDAFGNTVESKEEVYNPFRYAGEQYDTATGQYYLRARFYNPVIARFTQEDVYRGDGLNLYAYVSNNPVKYVDPSGYKECNADAVQGMESPVEGASKGIEKVLDAVDTYEQARNKALDIIEDLGATSKPYYGRLKSSAGNGKIVGRMSADEKVRWRLDYDPQKEIHINVEDFRNGKGANATKIAIPFKGDEKLFKSLIKHLNR